MAKTRKPRARLEPKAPDFGQLSPDAVIAAVESALGVACTNICRPLNSYINRVYEVGLGEGGFEGLDTGGFGSRNAAGYVVVKFYRPGRWSREALQDELDFLRELHEAEVPVVPPLAGHDGEWLHEVAGTYFAVFPKKGGRPLDEPSHNEWVQLGRLIARLHAVGARHPPRDRIRIHPRQSTMRHLEFIKESGTVAAQFRGAYEDTVSELVTLIASRRGVSHSGFR